MTDDQEKLQTMIIELIGVINRSSFTHVDVGEITTALPGIEDGTFFDLPFDEQNGLTWLNVALFGRGERGIPFFISGELREEFDTEYSNLLRSYKDSRLPPRPLPPSIETQRIERKLEESLDKAERIKKANKSEQATPRKPSD